MYAVEYGGCWRLLYRTILILEVENRAGVSMKVVSKR